MSIGEEITATTILLAALGGTHFPTESVYLIVLSSPRQRAKNVFRAALVLFNRDSCRPAGVRLRTALDNGKALGAGGAVLAADTPSSCLDGISARNVLSIPSNIAYGVTTAPTRARVAQMERTEGEEGQIEVMMHRNVPRTFNDPNTLCLGSIWND